MAVDSTNERTVQAAAGERPGLSPATASEICMHQCRAMCCRGPIILRLSAREALTFRSHAAALGVDLQMSRLADGAAWVRFSDYPGECCPMLDQATCACRIYQNRPQRCRDFPERVTPGCAISGA